MSVDFKKETAFNAIAITEEKPNISNYVLEYYHDGSWKPMFDGVNEKRIKINRFDRVSGTKVRMRILKSDHQAPIAEFGVYDEKR